MRRVISLTLLRQEQAKEIDLYIFATQFRRPWIFQTMMSVMLNNLGLKYQWLKFFSLWLQSKNKD